MVLQQPALTKRRSNGQQVLKIQEKVEAAKKLQLSGHQDPAEDLQEGPGGSSGHMEGPGGRGSPRPWRALRETWKDLGAEKHQGLEDLAEGPTEEMQEGPEGSSGPMEGPGGGGAPGPWGARQDTWKDLGAEEHQGPGELQEGPVGRVLQEGPAEELQEGPTEEPQEGPESGSTAASFDEEEEQQTAGP